MTREVVVIGGGVIGLGAAYHLAERGHRVTVLDRAPAPGAGCSHGNAGMLVPSHFVPLAAPGMIAQGLQSLGRRDSPFALRLRPRPSLLSWLYRFWRAARAGVVAARAPLLRDLHLASRAIYVDWSSQWAPGFELSTRGLLMLCNTAHGLEDETRAAEAASNLGLPAQVLTAAEVARLEPELRLDIAGAVRYPLDAHLSPSQLLAALAHQLAARGVAVERETVATGFRRRGGRVIAVETHRGPLEADEFVLAAGFDSMSLGRALDLSLPLQPGKGYSLTLPSPRRLPRHCALLSEARVAVTPLGTALRVGGTLELGEASATVDAHRVRGIVRSFVRFFPDFQPEDFAAISPWSGLRPCSPDGLPYLGRPGGYDNLVVATGHAMMGVSLAPITGRLVAELVSGERPSFDLTAMSPDRYR